MKIPYFELLNPYGFKVTGVGRVRSPRLREIGEKGYREYQYALTLLLMTPKEYYESIARATGTESMYETLSCEEQDALNIFTLFTESQSAIQDVLSALSFFIEGDLRYYDKSRAVLVNPSFEDDQVTADGVINAKNWRDVCEICLKCAYIDPPNKPLPDRKYKDEFTRKKFEEFYRKKEAYEKQKRAKQKGNPDYELANIISSLATFHNSLNMANIWDMTVYQVHDTFARQRQKEYIDVSDHNYAVWGGKDHKMDMWFKHMS